MIVICFTPLSLISHLADLNFKLFTCQYIFAHLSENTFDGNISMLFPKVGNMLF